MKYFEHFTLGLEAEAPGKHIVTEEEIIEFGTRWDAQPFHVDPEAAKDSLFGGLDETVVDAGALNAPGCDSEKQNIHRGLSM
jgi:acyl dehydratase